MTGTTHIGTNSSASSAQLRVHDHQRDDEANQRYRLLNQVGDAKAQAPLQHAGVAVHARDQISHRGAIKKVEGEAAQFFQDLAAQVVDDMLAHPRQTVSAQVTAERRATPTRIGRNNRPPRNCRQSIGRPTFGSHGSTNSSVPVSALAFHSARLGLTWLQSAISVLIAPETAGADRNWPLKTVSLPPP